MQTVVPRLEQGDVVEFDPGEHVIGDVQLNSVSVVAHGSEAVVLKGHFTWRGRSTLTGVTFDGRINAEDQAHLEISGCRLLNSADNLVVARGYSRVVIRNSDLSGSSTSHPAVLGEGGGPVDVEGSVLHDFPLGQSK